MSIGTFDDFNIWRLTAGVSSDRAIRRDLASRVIHTIAEVLIDIVEGECHIDRANVGQLDLAIGVPEQDHLTAQR